MCLSDLSRRMRQLYRIRAVYQRSRTNGLSREMTRADGLPVRHAPAVGRKMSYNQTISLREYKT
jgi:hypothetical protein